MLCIHSAVWGQNQTEIMWTSTFRKISSKTNTVSDYGIHGVCFFSSFYLFSCFFLFYFGMEIIQLHSLGWFFFQFLFFGKYLCFTNNEEQIHAANNLFIYSIKIEWKNATKRAGCETDDCSNSENFLLFVWHMIFFFLTIIVQQICFNPRSAWIDCDRMDNAKLDIRNICKPLFT